MSVKQSGSPLKPRNHANFHGVCRREEGEGRGREEGGGTKRGGREERGGRKRR
jgi:hypothetical protein